MRSTHTFATLPVSPQTYREISDKLRDAGYGHVFVEDVIDMTGIALIPENCPRDRERVLRNAKDRAD